MTRDDSGAEMSPILCVVGARPNFMKMAPILRAFAASQQHLPALLVHTGQHYDAAMSDQLFVALQLPQPDINLEVGSGSHAVQTAEVMRRFEPVVDQYAPSCVLVVGDVNSTLACSLVAVKKGIPVVHVEAGLRSFDRAMPEEINRVLTDQITDLLYITERSARDNLLREGIAAERIRFVGNVMIDSLLAHRARALAPAQTLQRANANASLVGGPQGYGVVTLHRPSNVDDAATLEALFRALVALRVKPYYLHHPDLAHGTGHLRVELAAGQDLMRDLRGRLSGIAQPTYVLDLPGGHGKVPVGPNYVQKSHESAAWRIEDPAGAVHDYPPRKFLTNEDAD